MVTYLILTSHVSSILGLAGEGLEGYWRMSVPKISQTLYQLVNTHAVVKISIVSCKDGTGEDTDDCFAHKQRPIVFSIHEEFPREEGWVQVFDLHGNKSITYMKKKNGGTLAVYKNDTDTKEEWYISGNYLISLDFCRLNFCVFAEGFKTLKFGCSRDD